MSVTCFDYFPWLRPAVHSWAWQRARQLDRLINAGGRRQVWYATDLLSAAAAAANPLLAPYESRDFLLTVPPQSYIWGVSVWGSSSIANVGGANPSTAGALGVEVEIIDTCTKEAWWRTSQDESELGEATYLDANTCSANNAATTTTDSEGYGLGLFLLPYEHLTADPGTQMVRITANAGNPTQTGPGPGVQAQVVLWVSTPDLFDGP